MNAKLSINGVLEVEGSEEFVKMIYNDFKNKMPATSRLETNQESNSPKTATPFSANQNKTEQKEKSAKEPKRSGISKNTATFNYVPDLWQGKQSLEFKNKYSAYEDPKSHPKYITLFLYILKQDLSVENITLDHLYTCYRLAGVKLPKHLNVAVNDAKKKAWVIDDWENLRLAPVGEDAVLHDFVKKAA